MIPHDITKRVAALLVIQRVRRSSHFNYLSNYLEYGGGRYFFSETFRELDMPRLGCFDVGRGLATDKG